MTRGPALKVRGREAAIRPQGEGPPAETWVRVPGAEAGDGFFLLLSPGVVAALAREGRSSARACRERGGWLVGQVLEGGTGVWVAEVVVGPEASGSDVAYRFGPEALASLIDGTAAARERLGLRGLRAGRIGWWHTHPGMGVFLSDADVDVHATSFPAPTDVAVVVAPFQDASADAIGAFRRVAGEVVPIGDVGIAPAPGVVVEFPFRLEGLRPSPRGERGEEGGWAR
ncbi:hypothetical protein L6R50_06980 [Myxococcota bacterium]|nr:hypothetical protein [Myxococcota bacterium]